MGPWAHGAMGPWAHGPMEPWANGRLERGEKVFVFKKIPKILKLPKTFQNLPKPSQTLQNLPKPPKTPKSEPKRPKIVNNRETKISAAETSNVRNPGIGILAKFQAERSYFRGVNGL